MEIRIAGVGYNFKIEKESPCLAVQARPLKKIQVCFPRFVWLPLCGDLYFSFLSIFLDGSLVTQYFISIFSTPVI